VDPSDLAHHIIYDEFFLRQSYPLDRIGFVPELILDCGAHIGLFTLLSTFWFPNARRMAFEPNPLNADRLEEHMRMNNVHCKLVRAAVTNHEGWANFSSYSGCDGRLEVSESAAKNNYQVPLVDLSALLRNEKARSLLLKVDIEGEERILLPAIVPILPQRTAIFFETHFGPERWCEAKELLQANGFQVQQLSARDGCADGFAYRGIGEPQSALDNQ